MQIFHVTTRREWEAAQAAGNYQQSTRGRTLAEEGFIHAATREQVAAVVGTFFADVNEPLIVLTIETERLDVPWRFDRVETATGVREFPHIYGPLPVEAVVQTNPIGPAGDGGSFRRVFFAEVFWRLTAAVIVMTAIAIGAQSLPDHPWYGVLAGALVGAGVVWLLARRRSG